MAEPLGIVSVPITPAGGVDHRLPTGTPVTPVGQKHDGTGGSAHDSGPSTEFHLGTTVEAIVRSPAVPATAGSLAVGTHLLLRIVALPSLPATDLVIGRVINSGIAETLIDTPLGLLAVQRRLTLAADTLIAFERLEEIAPPSVTADTPSRVGGWPALEEAINVLAQASPDLAARLRAELMPSSGPDLAGTLLFLWGSLYQSEWPGTGIATALASADHAKLAQRLSDDADELRRLENDPATGDWRVLTLPLFAGLIILPLRLFVRRRRPEAPPDELTRFAIEVELSGLGPLQLDGMLRGAHLVLVLRSHRGLPLELRQEAGAVYRRALQDWSMTGDLSFATAAQFALTPLSNLRKHIQISI
jgi:hypothetical protein